ncbi:HTH-type transcriptional activator CmpR [mine drainage metagenome]|uniref:HTH-type transcriptional activator CmpR n=1 Tax=mine drainage metagenome TaxID=410659 RepID=A0A1J5R1R2_9ZZZZ
MRHATLRQLKVCESIARHLSITRAAEELHLTQPTVSIQFKQLTDIVGLPLLEQVGKRLYLTDAGRELLKVCQSMFDSLARFEMVVSDLKGTKAGRLRLSVITTAQYFIPRLLGSFFARYPGIEVALEVTNRGKVLQRLADNADDLYVLGQPPEHMDVQAESFLDNPLVVVAPHDHPLARERNITLSRLAEEFFLIREPGSGTRLATENHFKDQNLALKVRMELGSNEAIKLAVAGGLGLAVLSAHTLALERNSDEITVLDVQGFPIRRQWYVLRPADKQLSVVAQTFLDFLRTESQAMARSYLPQIPAFMPEPGGTPAAANKVLAPR